MKSLRLSFIFLFSAFFCVANSNPLLGFFGKRNDDKAEVGDLDDKATVSIPSTAKSISETITTTKATTLGSSSSCGGLKGFLHICDKNDPTEPPKNVKTRSVPEKDSDESSDESESEDDDDDDSDESRNEKERKQATETSPSGSLTTSEPAERGVAKRQVGDPEAPVLGEVPPVISDSMDVPEEPVQNPEEDKAKEKRQVEDSNSNSNSDEDKTEEILQGSRRRRDCRDRDGYYGKNCRRKREFVPSCFGWGCKNDKTTEANK